MSGVMEAGMDGDQRAERAAGGKREVRWSARRKEEVVLRLLRGESATRRDSDAHQGAPGGRRLTLVWVQVGPSRAEAEGACRCGPRGPSRGLPAIRGSAGLHAERLMNQHAVAARRLLPSCAFRLCDWSSHLIHERGTVPEGDIRRIALRAVLEPVNPDRP